MHRNDGYFWLGLAPYWLRIVTIFGTVATALPGLQRIDSVMISGSDDWSIHGPVLLAGFSYVGAAVLIMLTGLTLSDLVRLALRSQEPADERETMTVQVRPEPTLAPLETSRALLHSLGVAPPQPARAHVVNVLQRNQ